MSWTSPPVIATGTLVTAAMWNANFSYLYDSGWVPLITALGGSMINSWASVGGPATGGTVAGIRTIGNVVRLGGRISGGGSGNGPGTLQAAYRPTYSVTLPTVTTVSANDGANLAIASTGGMVFAYPGGSVPALDGLTWTVD